MATLQATSDTITGIQNQINRYFYSNNYVVNADNLNVTNNLLGADKVKALKIEVKQTKLGYAFYQG